MNSSRWYFIAVLQNNKVSCFISQNVELRNNLGHGTLSNGHFHDGSENIDKTLLTDAHGFTVFFPGNPNSGFRWALVMCFHQRRRQISYSSYQVVHNLIFVQQWYLKGELYTRGNTSHLQPDYELEFNNYKTGNGPWKIYTYGG